MCTAGELILGDGAWLINNTALHGYSRRLLADNGTAAALPDQSPLFDAGSGALYASGFSVITYVMPTPAGWW